MKNFITMSADEAYNTALEAGFKSMMPIVSGIICGHANSGDTSVKIVFHKGQEHTLKEIATELMKYGYRVGSKIHEDDSDYDMYICWDKENTDPIFDIREI